ncbi:hypothetical protein FOA52_014715 [Chlamydomonas sp. UWO 241]|nr:hypothetical protein FOA52_014715 [Chlamydomonas sp. UWO 241]
MAPMMMEQLGDDHHVKVFRGTLVHTPLYGQMDMLLDRIVVVIGAKIDQIVHGDAEGEVLASLGVSPEQVTRLQDGQFLMPGLIDTHVHAPQYKFTGTGTDVPLMEWLKKYTFPAETSFQDLEQARHRYDLLVKRFLSNGTTTATYFGSLHIEPNKVLVDSIVRLGQRAVVGKVNMDRESPDNYIEGTAQGLADAEEFVQGMHRAWRTRRSLYNMDNNIEGTAQGLADAEEFVQYALATKCSRVYPCITPRFIPTCTMESMKGLAAIARKYDVHIQSHISECCGEVSFSRHLHPEFRCDAHVFDEAGLLTNKTLMAHGTLLDDDAIRLLVERGTSVSHCPLSNFFLGDAWFRVNHTMNLGLKVGLGTDVAGGISASMLTSIRMAVVNARCLRAHKLHVKGGFDNKMTARFTVTPDMEEDLISYKEGLYLATMGSARAINIDDKVGSFEVGKEWDALLVDVNVPGGPFDIFDGDSMEDQFEKFINLGDDRNIVEVYVQGTCVKRGDEFTGDTSKPVPVAPSDPKKRKGADC